MGAGQLMEGLDPEDATDIRKAALTLQKQYGNGEQSAEKKTIDTSPAGTQHVGE